MAVSFVFPFQISGQTAYDLLQSQGDSFQITGILITLFIFILHLRVLLELFLKLREQPSDSALALFVQFAGRSGHTLPVILPAGGSAAVRFIMLARSRHRSSARAPVRW